MIADGPLDPGLLHRPARSWPVTVEAGIEQLAGQALAPDDRGSDIPAEYRRAVVAAAGMTAAQVPAMLPEPPPQGGLAGRGQPMRPHADDPVPAICAHLTRLEEEIDALPRPPIRSAALPQDARPVQDL
ncbi:MAG: hypothetical protein ACLP52_15240, partial [Streptosporangiaceae bacterium]